ncbi:MAG: hypothetical protein ACK4ST_16120, partial [Elioraea tepidiphila]
MTLDFNATASLSGQISARIDRGLQAARANEKVRDYLGASRLGVECERALQFEYAKAPVDYGRDIDG